MAAAAAATAKGQATWIVVGASRGIGLEFTRQLLGQGYQVVAVVRNPSTANLLWQVACSQTRPGGCLIEQCDVRSEQEIEALTFRIKRLVDGGLNVEGVILNAGILKYPNRATETSFLDFSDHLKTNTVGPVIIAQKLLAIYDVSSPSQTQRSQSMLRPPRKIIFVSSDSGSMINFREFEDGFAAYGASKAALNMMVRHMTAELKRRGGIWDEVTIGCIHPGEVSTDMAAIQVDWEVEGIIGPEESVKGMLQVIESKGKDDSGGFWCWDGSPLVDIFARILNSDYLEGLHQEAEIQDITPQRREWYHGLLKAVKLQLSYTSVDRALVPSVLNCFPNDEAWEFSQS